MPYNDSLLQPVFEHPAYRSAVAAIEGGQNRATLSGLTFTAKGLVTAGFAHRLRRPIIVITSDNETADRWRETTATFLEWLGGPTSLAATAALPAFDCTPYEARSPHAEIAERRAVTLWNVARGQTRILIAPLVAALGRFREAQHYRVLALDLRVGDEIGLEDVVEHLKGVGYETGEPVEDVGQYSLRGGIIDCFSPESQWPFRVEFFGDRVESVREFDPNSQRSRKPVEVARFLPLQETKRSARFCQRMIEVLAQRQVDAAQAGNSRHSALEPELSSAFAGAFTGWEFLAPLVEHHPNALPMLFERPVLVWDEPEELLRQLPQTYEKWAAAYDEVRDILPPPPRPEEILLRDDEFRRTFEVISSISLKELDILVDAPLAETSTLDGQLGQNVFILRSQPAQKYHGAVKPLMEDFRDRLKRRESVTLVAPADGRIERLREILNEYSIPFEIAKGTSTDTSDLSASASTDGSCSTVSDRPGQGTTFPPLIVAHGDLAEGVAFPELGLLFIADNDLFSGFDWGRHGRKERSAASTFLSDLSDLKTGDYVVHIDHGIGLYQGLRQLGVEGGQRDFMLLTYQDDARLYLPLERLDLVEKFRRSGEGAKPTLDRLGGTTWARTKSRVKRSLRDMAEELLRLYAQRKMRGGFAFSADTAWQREFEDAFQFEETPDQITALAELKSDLESSQPMDRLLCGDVGYGKTELAMRAAFKVAQDGKQVAVLAPTTVLAFQHYNTFRQRMAPFPVRVEMISRFRSPAEQKQIAADTEAGLVDILIGTHRLLSKDMNFRDLGLLIVDEEQRFGVAAKEKLKKLEAGVDVLTMSATPIPRTLHMSIGGLRDLSVIETPPRGRLAIQTVVAPFSDGAIQAAILHEMERAGQVFFVHNRVESIFTMAALVQRLVPTARIGVAHGQMGEKELEKVMLKFIQGEYDVLAATALIENGLDIPRANTIIVNHADRFGLADLYQLRGRVGRSDRRAYAYFLVPAENALTPTAKRRLAALKEFSDLGAGFRFAALDLELRGAGNLLGAEQSGHMNSVGLDLYLQMLEEAVEELRGAPPKLEVRTTLNLGLDIKIPERYIEDESQRLRMYKRIASLSRPEARDELEGELVDRYGPPPSSVFNLLNYAVLKCVAERLMVLSIERKEAEVWIRFHSDAPVSAAKLAKFVRSEKGASLRPDGALRFHLTIPDVSLPLHLVNMLQQLQK